MKFAKKYKEPAYRNQQRLSIQFRSKCSEFRTIHEMLGWSSSHHTLNWWYWHRLWTKSSWLSGSSHDASPKISSSNSWLLARTRITWPLMEALLKFMRERRILKTTWLIRLSLSRLNACLETSQRSHCCLTWLPLVRAWSCFLTLWGVKGLSCSASRLGLTS